MEKLNVYFTYGTMRTRYGVYSTTPAESPRIRSLIPIEADPRFRLKPITAFRRSRSVFPDTSDQFSPLPGNGDRDGKLDRSLEVAPDRPVGR